MNDVQLNKITDAIGDAEHCLQRAYDYLDDAWRTARDAGDEELTILIVQAQRDIPASLEGLQEAVSDRSV